MGVYGYCRVSTPKQSLERQIRNIRAEYPDAVIITDEYTGTSMSRPYWTKLYNKLQTGDTVIFDSVSRMSRDAEEGFAVYEELFQKGVNLIFLKEHHIDTETYKKAMETGVPLTGTNVDFILEGVNKYLLSLAKEQIRLAFDQAEKEVKDNRQRTSEGLREVKARNERIRMGVEAGEIKQVGQPKGAKLTTKKSVEAKKVIMKRSKDFNGDLSDAEVMKLTGIARGTFYKYKRELRDEIEGHRSPMKVQFPNPKTIACKDCIFRDKASIEVDGETIFVGVTRDKCGKYNGKPHEVMFLDKPCPKYRAEA